MKITIPELSMVALVGASGSGKSTFARKHFKPTEVISSDFCRGLVSDDENDQSSSEDAFDVLHYIAGKRLQKGKLVVVDATNVSQEGRKPLVALAKKYHVIPVAIVFDLPEAICQERNKARPDRDFGPHVVRRHTQQMRRTIPSLSKEGFRHVFVLKRQAEVDAAEIERQPLWNNLKHEHGPFDIIGDVHGCFRELHALLTTLGYEITSLSQDGSASYAARHPEGRKAVFVGDLVDRGPDTPGVLRLVMSMVASGVALCVPGNHDIKLVRALKGKQVQVVHGLEQSLAQLEGEDAEFKKKVVQFLDGLVSHYVLDDGKLVVAHAGLREEMQGRGSGAVREFALYGETTGEADEFGLPVRYNWAAEYRGRAMVVYGHTPVHEPEWLNNTINIDTGCVMGGKLTALRYPEKVLVSVQAEQMYYHSPKPFLPPDEQAPVPALSAQQQHDDVLDVADVTGKRYLTTRLQRNVLIKEENAITALEVMSRFAVNPKWLIYLPPTMSPSETTQEEGLLEHPAEAFAYFRHEGVPKVVCEEKHMGSRAVVIVCRDENAARRRFGVVAEGPGIVYTRTGRPFFNDPTLQAEFLSRIRKALDAAGTWDEFNTDWVCLDCELMPWSAKAQELLRDQYAAVGVAARTSLHDTISALRQAEARVPSSEIEGLLAQYTARADMVDKYIDAYGRYCWPVNSISDLKLAPFHLLATEGRVHTDKDHVWQMETLARICQADEELLFATEYKVVDVTDEASQTEGVRWWEELTGRGGEGMVVKPLDFIVRGQRGLVQPAVKVRGREYLRIIYGPEYTSPENLSRLRSRRLAAKRGLALREFALGIEALERFVHREPLRRVHECAFGVLALESEPVDPRL
ncbi:MAG: polynucleotide kinase-phosphatase [Chloroflexi bacterium]|nr:polynucleotide kinase-phosphatase [Chloroflexota bacterium]